MIRTEDIPDEVVEAAAKAAFDPSYILITDPKHGEVLRITHDAITVNPNVSVDENAKAVLSALQGYINAANQEKDAEITRLRAQNAELVEALRPLACTCEAENLEECSRSEHNCAFWNARAALEVK